MVTTRPQVAVTTKDLTVEGLEKIFLIAESRGCQLTPWGPWMVGIVAETQEALVSLLYAFQGHSIIWHIPGDN